METQPRFSVSVNSEEGQYSVTVVESGTVTEETSFTNQKDAEDYREEMHRRLSTKYAMMGK